MGAGESKSVQGGKGGKDDDDEETKEEEERSENDASSAISKAPKASKVSKVSEASEASKASMTSKTTSMSKESAPAASHVASVASSAVRTSADAAQTAMLAKGKVPTLLVGLFAAVVLLLLSRFVRKRPAKPATGKKNSSTSDTAVSIQDLYSSILVLIVFPFEERSALSSLTTSPVRGTVLGLFNSAKEPSRVNVAIYDLGDSVHDSIPTELQCSVQVERNMRLKAKHASETDARAHLMKKCYSGERFVMTLSWSASLTVHKWDEELLLLYNSALRKSPNPILTGNCGGRDTVTESSSSSSRRTNRASFPVIRSMGKGGKLDITYIKTKDDPEDVFESLTWSPAFSFARADAYIDMFICDSIVGSSGMDITLHTIKLLSYGFKFYALPFTLAHCNTSLRSPDWRRKRGRRAESASTKPGHVMTMQEVAHVLGVSFARRVVSKRSKAGLTASPTPLEARLKAGSVEASTIAFT